jgi:MbtH protein
MSEDRYIVVRNAEDQHSVWFAGRELPAGWTAAGFAGTRAECLAWINENWRDLRPLSLRSPLQSGS